MEIEMKVYQIVACDGYHEIYGDVYASKEKAELVVAHSLALRYDDWISFKGTAEAEHRSAVEAMGYTGTFESYIQYDYHDSINEIEVIL